MITLPPSELDLHAYVDQQLSAADRLRLETWLAVNPDVALQVKAWQADAKRLRAALSGDLKREPNPELDPAFIRQRLRRHRYRHLATAAMLVVAVGFGGLSGWQAREMTLSSTMPPMADALQAYRMFAVNDNMASDWSAAQAGDAQVWLDRHFNQANRLPDLEAAGFKPVTGRMTTTEQGAAAMVVYKDPEGRTLSFYIRPPGAKNHMLPRGSRQDGDLQADYWSGSGYNYAVVSPTNDPAAQQARKALPGAI